MWREFESHHDTFLPRSPSIEMLYVRGDYESIRIIISNLIWLKLILIIKNHKYSYQNIIQKKMIDIDMLPFTYGMYSRAVVTGFVRYLQSYMLPTSIQLSSQLNP